MKIQLIFLIQIMSVSAGNVSIAQSWPTHPIPTQPSVPNPPGNPACPADYPWLLSSCAMHGRIPECTQSCCKATDLRDCVEVPKRMLNNEEQEESMSCNCN